MASNEIFSNFIGLLIFLGLMCISDAGKGMPDKFYHVQRYGAVSDGNDADGVELNKFYDVQRYGAVSDGKTDNSQVSRKEICS